jgi:hypothetical protein
MQWETRNYTVAPSRHPFPHGAPKVLWGNTVCTVVELPLKQSTICIVYAPARVEQPSHPFRTVQIFLVPFCQLYFRFILNRVSFSDFSTEKGATKPQFFIFNKKIHCENF